MDTENRPTNEIKLSRDVAFVGANPDYWDVKSFYDMLGLSSQSPFKEIISILENRAISEGVMRSADTTDRILAQQPIISISDRIERPESTNRVSEGIPMPNTDEEEEVELEPTS